MCISIPKEKSNKVLKRAFLEKKAIWTLIIKKLIQSNVLKSEESTC